MIKKNIASGIGENGLGDERTSIFRVEG